LTFIVYWESLFCGAMSLDDGRISAQEVTVIPRKSVDDVLSVAFCSAVRRPGIWAGLWTRDHLLTLRSYICIEVRRLSLKRGCRQCIPSVTSKERERDLDQ